MKALVIAADGFEDVELSYPYYRLEEESFDADLATPDSRSVEGKHGYEYDADLGIREVDVDEYAVLVIPGGNSPENLRMDAPRSVEITRDFVESGRFVSSICHGAQLLMSADVLDGRQATCYPAIKDDLENAGATFVDDPVVVDGKVVTSRYPDDLPEFMHETLTKLKRARVKDV